MPDLWGFGSSREPPAVAPAFRRQAPHPAEVRPRRPSPPLRLAPAGHDAPPAIDPLTALIGMIARLFG